MTHFHCLPGAGAGSCGGDPEPTKPYVRILVFSTVWDFEASAMRPGENISPPLSSSSGLQEALLWCYLILVSF